MDTLNRLVLVTSLSLSATALAVPPHQPDLTTGGSLWLMQAFNDTDPNHKQIFKEEICFKFTANLGTHMRYVWQSQSYPDFRGVATQEGDHVMLHGDYTQQGNAVYHDAMIFDLVTQSPRDLGAGHWTMWQEDGAYGKTLYSANVTMERQPQSTCSVKVVNGGAGLSPEDLFRQQ